MATTEAELRPSDRCDRCGARAVHRYLFAAGELLLCGHHQREHDAAIREHGARIQTTPRSG